MFLNDLTKKSVSTTPIKILHNYISHFRKISTWQGTATDSDRNSDPLMLKGMKSISSNQEVSSVFFGIFFNILEERLNSSVKEQCRWKLKN